MVFFLSFGTVMAILELSPILYYVCMCVRSTSVCVNLFISLVMNIFAELFQNCMKASPINFNNV